MQRSRLFLLLSIVAITAMSRLLPHPPNFSPVMAVSLFSGALLLDKKYSILVPILAMLISDFFLGFHILQPLIYALMVITVLMGWSLKNNMTPFRILGTSLAGSVLFFAGSNFGVWLTSEMYTKDLAGLAMCYTAAIPFFQNSLSGDVLFTVVLFGSVYVLEKLRVLEPVA